MGCFGSKQKISKVDLEYLKKHTRYDEATIKEWFKGFRVSLYLFLHLSLSLFPACIHIDCQQSAASFLHSFLRFPYVLPPLPPTGRVSFP